MQRDGFLLGVVATGCQVLLLRELISSLQGDEFFVGIALAGWLLWGAFGAYLSGRSRTTTSSARLLSAAILILPAAIVIARLSPMLVTETVGEPVSFSGAALLSVLLTLPVGFVCGWTFSTIVRRKGSDSATLMRIYFSEGLGAFVAGAVVSLLTSSDISTLSTAGALSCVILAAVLTQLSASQAGKVLIGTAGVGVSIGVIAVGPTLDRLIDRYKYHPYEIVASFDTPYSHQTILRRGGARVLLTDNVVESVEGDIQMAENVLLPPLTYVPRARDILVIGQADLTLKPLVASLPNLSVTAVDPRSPIDSTIQSGNLRLLHVTQDPITYLRSLPPSRYDVIILSLGQSGSYRELRFLTNGVLSNIQRVLRRHGVLHVVTPYASERYITPEDAQLLSTVRATLGTVFPYIIVWPGENTLFLAADSAMASLSADSVAARLAQLQYQPQFLDAGYLIDRLSAWQVARVTAAIATPHEPNSLEHPSLASMQIARGSQIHPVDRWVASMMTWGWPWKLLLVVLIVAIVVPAAVGRSGRSLGLTLYFAAGLMSLTLELISFYVYQSSAGMLYSQLSLLIGAFMLGLATGTRIAMGVRSMYLTSATLALFTLITVIFAITCLELSPKVALPYHILFQFLVAACTGALFIVATRQYYGSTVDNAGLGYGFELAGSSLAAVITLPLLLPTVGLQWLLGAVALLAGLLLAAGLLRPRTVKAGQLREL